MKVDQATFPNLSRKIAHPTVRHYSENFRMRTEREHEI